MLRRTDSMKYSAICQAPNCKNAATDKWCLDHYDRLKLIGEQFIKEISKES